MSAARAASRDQPRGGGRRVTRAATRLVHAQLREGRHDVGDRRRRAEEPQQAHELQDEGATPARRVARDLGERQPVQIDPVVTRHRRSPTGTPLPFTGVDGNGYRHTMASEMHRGLRHIALRTRDLRRTERFYLDVLGLRPAFSHPGMIFLETPGGRDLLNFVGTRRRFDPDAGGLDHFGLHVPPAKWKAVCERVKRAGVRIRGRRGRASIYIEDPNGYTVELYRD
jgi:catechol 2,3-dioxygenase-like lactoylglutathione lyase family enzyme